MTAKTEFILLGAGLPRTGTASTRAALELLLPGKCYHMATVFSTPEHHPFWEKTLTSTPSTEEWHQLLEGFSAGVDYPISAHYKQLFKVFPNAKVLMTVRDPEKWFVSVRDSIFTAMATLNSWPCSWFNILVGNTSPALVRKLSDHIPTWCGVGLFTAVAQGREASLQFWSDHQSEVRSVVPPDQLLVFDVREGWEPLCRFLDVPVPDGIPFPRVNETKDVDMTRKTVLLVSWTFVVFLPLFLSILWFWLELGNPLYLIGVFCLMAVIGKFFNRFIMKMGPIKLKKA